MKRRNSRMAGAAAVLAAAGLLAACGSTAAAAPAARKVSHRSSMSIGFILKPVDNPYFATMGDGARAEAKKLHVPITIEEGDSLTDPTEQADTLAAMITHGYSCYIADPVNATNLVAPLVRAQSQHAPIVNIDLPISPRAAKAAGVHLDTYIGTDNLSAGILAGERLAQMIPAHSQVAIIGGPLTDPTSIPRVKGFREGADHRLVVVQADAADWDTTTALDDTAALLEKYPKLRGVLVANGEMAEGVQRAIQNAHKQGKVDTVAIIGDTTTIKDVEHGIMASVIEQFPYVEGVMGVQACFAVMHKRRLPISVVTPTETVTRANAARALAAFPRPFGPFKDPLTALDR